jgi:enediyne biosynthesis protein E4
MPPLRSRFAVLLSALCLFALWNLGVRDAWAQSFVKVVNPANAIATMGGAPPGSFVGTSWIDSDGDGDADLFTCEVGLFRNDGGGVFTLLADALPNMGFAIGNTWADVDNDGDVDCFISGGTPNGSALYRNDGGNHFTKVTSGALADSLGNGAWGCAFGDADLDGFVDVVTAAAFGFNGGDNPNRFLHNLGGNLFVRVDSLDFVHNVGPYTVPTWSDFDDDGDPDLFISAGPANGTQGLDFLYRNRLESSPLWFRRITEAPLGTDVHDGQVYNWIDYDNDGDLDLYLTNFGGGGLAGLPNDLYRNDGNGVFLRLTGPQVGPIVTDVQRSLGSVWQDYDNDGDLDCYVSNAGAFPSKFYRNDGGTFTSLAIAGLTGTGPHWGAASADFDADGDMDIYVAGTTATHGLYENTTVNGNGWLDVVLTGTVANRSAIGARVRLLATIGGQRRWQQREVSAQNSFCGQNTLVQHFGLGDAAEAESLIVEWPGGGRTVRTSLTGRQRLSIQQEGATAVEASLLQADVVDGAVHLTWWTSAANGGAAAVERSRGHDGWQAVGTTTFDGNGRATYVDTDVEQGQSYGYRLALDEHLRTAETWVAIPSQVSLGIRAVTPNPTPGRFLVTFDLPAPDAAAFEVLDVSGRRIERRELGSLAAGRHVLALGGSRLAPGVYLVRLTQAGRRVTSRVTVLN